MNETALRDRETPSTGIWLMRGLPVRNEGTARGDLPVRGELLMRGEPPTLSDAGASSASAAEEHAPATRRDWSSALDLIHEATAAIRISEERALELEQELARTVAQAVERSQQLEAQIAAAQDRAQAAEKRASDAEAWLARLHDAVVTGFTRKEAAQGTRQPKQPSAA